MQRVAGCFFAVIALTACASPNGTAPTDGGSDRYLPPIDIVVPTDAQTSLSGDITTDTTLCGTITLTAPVRIPAGVTVTLCPGAQVFGSPGAGLAVAGQLTTTPNTTENVTFAGSRWNGIVVSQGGRITLAHVQIFGAITAITVNAGAMPSTVSHALIRGSKPLTVQPTASLTMTNSEIIEATADSTNNGSLILEHVNYDSAGNEGITTSGDNATLTITDSRLTTASNGADFVVTGSGNLGRITLVHNELYGSHCTVHLNRSIELDIHDNVFHDNVYAFMLGGATTNASRRIYQNNIIRSSAHGILEISVNLAINATGNYFADNTGGNASLFANSAIDVSAPLSSPVQGAGVRTP